MEYPHEEYMKATSSGYPKFGLHELLDSEQLKSLFGSTFESLKQRLQNKINMELRKTISSYASTCYICSKKGKLPPSIVCWNCDKWYHEGCYYGIDGIEVDEEIQDEFIVECLYCRM